MTAKMIVPMLDLGYQHALVADEVHAGFDRILERSSYILSEDVSAFESRFAEYCGVSHVVGVGNGTDAIELALRGAGVGAGDEVIIPANTFVATAEAVVRAGATPVFADCGEDYLLDPASAASRRTERTAAVIPVHLYGQTADVDAIREAVGADILLIEDAAQAQGAVYRGRRAGSLGEAAATSFYPGKNLGAYGDAGAVITSSDTIAERVRRLRNHGGVHKYEHLEIGTNSRLDALQAVVLSAKLEHLDEWNAERRAIAARYGELLSGVSETTTPLVNDGNEHVYHQYVIQVDERDRVVAELNAAGIGAGVHYPAPVHLLAAFAAYDSDRATLTVAERTGERLLSLPIYPGLTLAHVELVVDRLLASLATASGRGMAAGGAVFP